MTEPLLVDLNVLTDRAQAYVAGLEAKLGQRRAEIERLKAELADPSKRDREAIAQAYKQGWADCANHLGEVTRQAECALKHLHGEASRASWNVPDQPS